MSVRLDRIAALRAERAALLAVCDELTESQWRTASKAAEWTVHDVVAHIGSGCHAMFSPSALTLLRSNDIERTNDDFVAARRSWISSDVLEEYRTWSGRVVTLAAAVSRTPLAGIPLPLGELGRFPASLLLGGALVFDHHTHLRHDVLPALGLASSATDSNRMGVVTEWMTAVLTNQLRADKPSWLDRPIGMALHGLGGGTWMIDSLGARRVAGIVADTHIEADVEEFPEWGTRRCQWRHRAVAVCGDEDYGIQLLDYINIV